MISRAFFTFERHQSHYIYILKPVIILDKLIYKTFKRKYFFKKGAEKNFIFK